METNELKQYLKDAYELESQLHSLNCLKNEFEESLEVFQEEKEQKLEGNEIYLGYDENYVLKQPKTDPISCENLSQYVDSHAGTLFEGGLYAGNILSVDVFPAKWKNAPDISQTIKRYEQEKEKLSRDCDKREKIFIIGCIISVILAVVVMITCGFVASIILAILAFGVLKYYNNATPKSLEEYKEVEKELGVTVRQYCDSEEKLKHKWNHERCVYIGDQYQNRILPSIIETERAREAFYAKNIIHPKYRTLVAVAQMYEYIDTGRCTELEGPNGAYNLFEKELRDNTIIDKLDVIIDNLEQLNATMNYISRSIDKANELAQNIVWSLDAIETNTAITASNTALIAYNTQCTSYNTELMRRYHY